MFKCKYEDGWIQINIFLVFISILIGWGEGQVSVQGKYRTSSYHEALLKTGIQYTLPKQLNIRALRLATLEMQRSDEKPPYKFGNAIPYSLDAAIDGEWTLSADGTSREWRAVITSPSATTLSINFDQFFLPLNSRLFVIGRNQTLGAFVGQLNNKPDGRFSTTPLFGDVIILEYVESLVNPFEQIQAKDNTKSKLLKLRVESVVHGFRRNLFQFQDSGHCNIDVACPQGNGLRDQMNSVGLIIADNGQRFCTGTLLNNPRQDGGQLFLTAEHCARRDTTNYIVAFNYQYEQCVSGGHGEVGISPMQTVQGLKLLAKWDKSDFALFEILEPIPDGYHVFYAGWSRANVAPFNVSSIHYPSGDAKKISRFFGTCIPSSVTEAPRTYHWRVKAWTEGVTEPGSSGSALFDANGRVVAHLHGGISSCDNLGGHDNFGALAVDWETAPIAGAHAKTFLDPDNQGVIGMSGNYYVTQKIDGAKSRLSVKVPLGDVNIELAPEMAKASAKDVPFPSHPVAKKEEYREPELGVKEPAVGNSLGSLIGSMILGLLGT